MDTATSRINNIVLASVPTVNYQGTLQSLYPLDEQRDQEVCHVAQRFNSRTKEMIQTKHETDAVNEAGHYLKNAEGKNSSLKLSIETHKKELEDAKHKLQFHMSRQKIVFDLFLVFGATITVYLLFRSFSFVHILAVIVLVIGILYVLQYNAYRIHLFGDDDSSKVFPFSKSHANQWWNTLVSGTTPSFNSSKWMYMIRGQLPTFKSSHSQDISATTS
jgi:hypothetical protein